MVLILLFREVKVYSVFRFEGLRWFGLGSLLVLGFVSKFGFRI